MSRQRSSSSLWVGAAVLFGLAMRGLAALAAGHPQVGDVLIGVVNWAALWAVVPVLAGRGARSLGTAAALGVGTAGLQVLVFYGGVSLGAPTFKLAWLSGGAVAAGAVATLAQRLRARGWTVLLLPALFVVEPALSFLALQLLGREPWSGWTVSAVAEVCVGLAAAAVVSHRVIWPDSPPIVHLARRAGPGSSRSWRPSARRAQRPDRRR